MSVTRATKRARRSDALYYSDIIRRGLCDRIAALESELEERREGNMLVQIDEGAYEPVRAHETDAGMDIRSPKGFVVPAKGSATVHTGVHVQLPENTVGILKSKSGLNVKHGIIGEGVIDEGYSGEIVVKLYNLGDVPYIFEAGDKIIQLLVMPVLYVDVQPTRSIEGGSRGSDGFGSTGK